ncbi:MAG TPA: ATP-binding protein [Gemmatimonadaceae bacterium]|jgi:PAS domain S-box-containing protein
MRDTPPPPATYSRSSVDPPRATARAAADRAEDIERLQRAAARANALQQITEELARPIEYVEVVEAIVRASVQALGARAGAVFEWQPEPPSFCLACAFNYSPDIVAQLDRIPADARALEAAGIQSGEPIVFETHAVFERSFPRLAGIDKEVETRILLPLRAAHELIGILALSFGVERGVPPNERAFARAVARQCSLALERARLYQREQQARTVAESATARLEEALDAMSDQHFVCDTAGRYVRFNRAARDFLRRNGYDPDELIGKVMWEEFPLLVGGPMYHAVQRALKDGISASFDARSRYATSWYEGHAYPVGEGIAVYARDVTERRQADEANQFLADATSALAQSLEPDLAIAEITRGLVPAFADISAVFVRGDDARVRPVAYAGDAEFVQLLWDKERRRPLANVASHPVHRVLTEGTSVLLEDVTAETVSRIAPGEPHLVDLALELGMTSLMYVPLTARGRTLGVLSVATTGERRRFSSRDRVLAEEIARRSAIHLDNARLFAAAERARTEAERASQAKSEFLAVMSHELRTPLNAIAGYTELLEMGVRGPVNAQQIEDLKRIKQSQRHLLGLINELLNFARLDAGGVHFDFRDIAVAECISATLALVEPQVRSHGLKCEADAIDPAIIVHTDAEKLRQILLNLFSNAIKYTPRGGYIRVLVDYDTERVRLQVADTGAGIPADKLETIFEPFVQVNRTLSTANDGVGLGLAISRDLARAMGGDLTVESRLSSGSTFTVHLKRAQNGGDGMVAR